MPSPRDLSHPGIEPESAALQANSSPTQLSGSPVNCTISFYGCVGGKKFFYIELYRRIYKKGLNYLENHDGVVTHLEPDILECEVKWALESINMNKPSGGDGIPVELFQILKDDALKVLHSICQQIWKIQQWSQDWKMSVFIPFPKKGNAKECSNYRAIALISHASKILLKILQARLP